MLFSLVTLAIAIFVIYINRKFVVDEIAGLPLKPIGLFYLFLSLLSSPWPIKLSIAIALLVIPVCDRQHYYQWRIRCSPNCNARSNCPGICF